MFGELQDTIIANIIEKEIVSIDFIEKETISVEIIESDNFISPQTIEKDVIIAEIVEKELICSNFKALDVLFTNRKLCYWIQEEPIKIIDQQFKTSFEFISESLEVFLNGLKIKSSYINKLDSRTFEILDAPLIGSDLIEVAYLKSEIS